MSASALKECEKTREMKPKPRDDKEEDDGVVVSLCDDGGDGWQTCKG